MLTVLGIIGSRPVRSALLKALNGLCLTLNAWTGTKVTNLHKLVLAIIKRFRKLICAFILRLGRNLLLIANP